MSLTGLPLILLSGLLAVLTIAGTVLLWSRFGRWRLVSRTVGVLLAEVLVVLTAGLVYNRIDGFYPSWQALGGETGTTSQTAKTVAGRLDVTLGHNTQLPWQPADVASWRLAGTPTVIFPTGYQDRPSVEFSVVLALTDSPAEAAAAVQAAHRTPGVVTVVAVPTAATTATVLGRFAADLIEDVRVTPRGWAVVTTTHGAALAAGLINGLPGQFAGEALIGPAQPAGVRLTVPVSFAVVHGVAGPAAGKPGKGKPRTAGQPGSSGKTTSRTTSGTTPPAPPPPSVPSGAGALGTAGSAVRTASAGRALPHGGADPHKGSPHGKGTPRKNTASPGPLAPAGKGAVPGRGVSPSAVVTLTCPRTSVWAVAVRWAADQTSLPLQPAILLPEGKP